VKSASNIVPPIKTWIAIGAFVAFILIPICWKFWKGWDRPSRAAKAEMQRRIRERDVRETFLREDAKTRELERAEAQRELSRKKAQAPAPVESSILKRAFDSLDDELE
jgi:type VI protein secretion system component VasK